MRRAAAAAAIPPRIEINVNCKCATMHHAGQAASTWKTGGAEDPRPDDPKPNEPTSHVERAGEKRDNAGDGNCVTRAIDASGVTPNEAWSGNKPDVLRLHVFIIIRGPSLMSLTTNIANQEVIDLHVPNCCRRGPDRPTAAIRVRALTWSKRVSGSGHPSSGWHFLFNFNDEDVPISVLAGKWSHVP
jgi:hypothetical protein